MTLSELSWSLHWGCGSAGGSIAGQWLTFTFQPRLNLRQLIPFVPALTLTFLFKQLLLTPAFTSCACGGHNFHSAVLKEPP